VPSSWNRTSLFNVAVVFGEIARYGLPGDLLASIVFLRSLPNARQDFHARLEIRLRDTSQQFMAKFVGCCVNLRDHPLGAPAEQHHVAASIVWRAIPRDPPFFLQAM
jgi:hypothetical protein